MQNFSKQLNISKVKVQLYKYTNLGVKEHLTPLIINNVLHNDFVIFIIADELKGEVQ